MFTKAERALIEELREQDAPLERWAKFFPGARISDLIRQKKSIDDYPGYVYTYNGYLPIPVYAQSMKKGNIYMWDSLQDSYLASIYGKDMPILTIAVFMKEKFGIERTSGAIISRLTKLGII